MSYEKPLLNPSQVIFFEEGNNNPLYFKLEKAVFLAFEIKLVHQNEMIYFGICVLPNELKNNLWFNKYENFLVKKNIKNIKLISVKILSQQGEIKELEALFVDRKIEILKNIKKEEACEVIYYPNDGRIRVEKSSLLKMQNKIKILIVDDSSTIRGLLKTIFSKDPEIEVVAEAGLPSEVEALILEHKPDVITLDIHMPEMDGVTLLKKYIQKFPIPTVMISSISMEEGPMVFNALESGAVDYVQKPSLSEIEEVGLVMIEKVKTASLVDVRKTKLNNKIGIISNDHLKNLKLNIHGHYLLIGSSTGGTEALKDVLLGMPHEIPPTLVVQHIPPVFSAAFAVRLNQLCPFEVKEAENGDEIVNNCVYIAPGGKQMKLRTIDGKLKIVIDDSAPVNRHKPSVDVLFQSAVDQKIAKKCVGVILTGMGADGAKGLLELKKAGALFTLAQSEQTCVVYGMPKEAVKLGAVDKSVDLSKISSELIRVFNVDFKKSA